MLHVILVHSILYYLPENSQCMGKKGLAPIRIFFSVLKLEKNSE